MVIDLFCGGGELARACDKLGLATCAFGYYGSACSTSFPVISLDASARWAKENILEVIHCNPASTFAWIAPPCGTLSFARDRPVPAHLTKRGCPNPPPLRSFRHLEGLPTARADSTLAEKLRRANDLIAVTFEVVLRANKLGASWAVLNPKGSYLWSFPQWREIAFKEVDFDSSSFGGRRKIAQRIRTSVAWLSGLASSSIPRPPESQPSFQAGSAMKFAISRSDILPDALCSATASLIEKNMPSPEEGSSEEVECALAFARASSYGSDANKTKVALQAAAAGWQARGRRLAPMVSEYKRMREIQVSREEAAKLKKRQRLKPGAKLGKETISRESQVVGLDIGESGDCDSAKVELGLAWTPEEFVEEARQYDHPFSDHCAPDEVIRAVFNCLTQGPAAVERHQTEFKHKWEARAEALREEEKAFCAQLHPDVAPFAQRKRPLLLKEMLSDLGFPAAELTTQFVAEGVPMFGPMPETGVFPKRAHPASMTRDQLLKSGKWARPALLHSKPTIADKETNDELWKVTIEERDRGECRGPFTPEQLDALLPHGWVPARRFAVSQKKKIRPCDDYSAFGHNATSSSTETVDTHGTDSIVGMLRLWVGALRDDGRVVLYLSDGTRLEGKLHPSLTAKMVRDLLARLVDLKRAYKQLARTPADAPFAVFAVWHKEMWNLFMALALGFGGRNSVNGFNLPARALMFILNVGLWIATMHFFDDFSQISPRAFRCHADAFLWLLRLLGWEYKSGPEDLLPPASAFAPLGVAIDMSTPGVVVVDNTEKRKAKILQDLEQAIQADFVAQPEVDHMVGVCQYAEAQCSGRSGALALRGARLASKNRTPDRTVLLARALTELRDHVVASVPRRISLAARQKPLLIFTDAAAEDNSATLGGVLFDDANSTVQFFSCRVAPSTISKWKSEGVVDGCADQKNQIICQAELLAIPVALKIWESRLAQRDVVFFVDNDPAKDALIHGISASHHSSELVRFTRITCARLGIGAWYERVPSPSNIADSPSRGDYALMRRLGATRVEPLIGELCQFAELCEF